MKADRVCADEKFARHYGVDPALAAAGRPIGEFMANFHPDEIERVAAEIDAALTSLDLFSTDYRIRRPDGSWMWVNAQGRATHDADGKPDYVIAMAEDVTEQRRIDANREELVNRMAHDLRNPLMAMGGYAELIETMGDLSVQQQHFVTRLRQTTSKLYDVAAELVDLVWIEAGLPIQHRPVRLQEPIMRAIAALTPLAEERKIGIAFSVQDPLPKVMGDPERLYMVIYQLLENALLYSEGESSIAIHAWSDGADVYCSVADKGIGVSDHEIHLIFDRLFRSSDTRVQAIPGGGLGLTIAKKIVYRHGGDIWVASNLGDGSTFTFVLPAVSA